MSQKNRSRPIGIKLRFTQQELQLVAEKMEQLGTTNREAYLRKMAIDGYVLKLDVPVLKEMVTLLRRRHSKSGFGKKCENFYPALPPSNSLAYAVSLQTSPGCGMT